MPGTYCFGYAAQVESTSRDCGSSGALAITTYWKLVAWASESLSKTPWPSGATLLAL